MKGHYKVFSHYNWTTSPGGPHAKDFAPEGFDHNPDLETYLNHIWDLGYRVISVCQGESFTNIVTEPRP